MPKKAAWARVILPAKPWTRLVPMQTIPNTANRPRSSNVESERPTGNTARKANPPASVVHLTNPPVVVVAGQYRLRPSRPTRATVHSQSPPVNCERPRGTRTTAAVATTAAAATGTDSLPRSTTGIAGRPSTRPSAGDVAAFKRCAPRRSRTSPEDATGSRGSAGSTGWHPGRRSTGSSPTSSATRRPGSRRTGRREPG